MNSPNSNEFNLDSIPVRVNKVKFDGLSRTKTSFVDPTTENVYKAKTFGDLIFQIGLAQEKLRQLEIFRDVGVIIDIDRSEGGDYKFNDGYDITFAVKELSRIAMSAKTEVGANAEAQLKTGVRMPNLFGSGERLEIEYAYSSVKEENMQFSVTKPFPYFLDSSWRATMFRTIMPNPEAGYLTTAIGSLVTYFCTSSTKTLKFPSVNHRFEYEGTWRELSAGSFNTVYSIREQCGHSFKSAIKHVLTVDGRDRQMFAKRGTFWSFTQELAGLLGDVKYYKFDADVQHNLGLPLGMTFQGTCRIGMLTPLDNNEVSCGISDRFFLGGPSSLRGFQRKGVQVGLNGISLGGKAYLASALHLFMPLFYLNRKYPMVENCRLHFFINGGNLTEKLTFETILQDVRIACGCGLAIAFGNFGRFEINYCVPVKRLASDKVVNGVQVGVGVQFL